MESVIGAAKQVEPSSELIYTASYRITAHIGPVNMGEYGLSSSRSAELMMMTPNGVCTAAIES